MGSASLLYDELAPRTRDPVLQSQLRGWATADRAALASGTFSALSLNRVPPAQFLALKAGFAGDGKAHAMFDALVASACIYQLNETERYFENNQVRSDLMVRQFIDRYRVAGTPRVLVKAGAFHMGRGISPTGVFDLGSVLPGLAAATGRQSLHIAMVPYTGRVRSIAPDGQGFTKLVDHKEGSVAQLLAVGGITPEQLPASGHVLIPLEPIRQQLGGKARRALPEFARFMVLGFDYLVTTRDAAPATHFEAWTPRATRAR